MKVLIIGYGSIGRRHDDVLSQLEQIEIIDLVTKQNIKNRSCYKTLEEIDSIEKYDYFIIASETNKHYKQLKYLDNHVFNKLIFCEKPLFEEKKDLEILNNKVYVGYVLRFHPLLQKLKDILQKDTIISINVKCGQYLPYWRPNINYKDNYSAKKEEGGGVLLDLSHEIDYIQYFCGKINDLNSYQVKISDLEINSDDLTILIGKSNKNVIVNMSIDYISKIVHRRVSLETLDYTYELDLVKNKLVSHNKQGIEKIYELSDLERNFMFKEMHLDIFNKQKIICTFKEALDVMKTISTIQEQNK